MKLTRKQAIKLHREMWSWLAETGAKCKSNWPRFKDLYETAGYCFCCEFEEIHKGHYCGATCILVWPPDDRGCSEQNDPFTKWYSAKTKKTRQKYARIIAELPAR